VGNIKKSHYSAAISANIVVGIPVFIFFIILSFIVWFVVSVLVERVLDAFVEDLFGILWPIRTFRPRDRVMQPKIIQERREVVFVILNVELLVKKVFNLLFFPWLTLA